jgi:hypothetical protein
LLLSLSHRGCHCLCVLRCWRFTGAQTQCAPPSWWDDGIDNRPSWYPRNAAYPCWTVDTTNWMNGQLYLGLPNNTPGWPGWIHGVTWCVVEIVSSLSPYRYRSYTYRSYGNVSVFVRTQVQMYAGDRSFRRTHTQRGSGRLMWRCRLEH